MARAPRRSVPTIRTVAEAAGVSTATVSYVLNDRGTQLKKVRISESTRRRVLDRAAELGYAPNQSARGTRRGRTDQVCLILGYLDSPWSQAMMHEVSTAADAVGLTTLVLAHGDWERFLSGGGADGAIIDLGTRMDLGAERLRALARRGVALVVLNNDIEPDGFDVVRRHPGQACAEAVRLLLADGRRVACLRSGPADGPHGAGERYESYERVLREAGVPVDPELVRDTFDSRDTAYREALSLLDRPGRPTAVFATNDLAGISTLWAAHRLGLSVPEDLAIVGVGNSPEARAADPPLTTVGTEPIFDQLSEMLLSRLRGDAPAAGRLYEPASTVHRRGTTR